MSRTIENLPEFPFRRLAALLAGVAVRPDMPVLDFSIGEPKHAPPALLAQTVAANSADWNRYPPAGGLPTYRTAAAKWLEWRFGVVAGSIREDRNILPVAGTKEGLFLLPMLADWDKTAVLMPNPLYSVYLGGAAMAGFEPVLLAARAANGFLPDLESVDEATWRRTAMVFLCNPSNPQGAVASDDYLEQAIQLARTYDFILVLDECYSEIYDRQPPNSALAVAQAMSGNFDNILVMHSLSKRSNAAGLRSGFVAGDARLIQKFLKLRAYGAAVQPLPLMAAATALWQDEAHVDANREAYRRKIDLAERKLGNRFGFYRPAGGFFLWLDVGDGVAAAKKLWRDAALKVLPGAFLTAPCDGEDPGLPYIRLALVHDEATVNTALERLIDVLGDDDRAGE